MDNKILAEIDSIANNILADYGKGRTIDKTDVFNPVSYTHLTLPTIA